MNLHKSFFAQLWLKFALAVMTTVLFCQPAVSRQAISQQAAAAAEDEAERWFEVEVIVFKPANDQGLTDEAWNKDQAFSPAQNAIDFLQPYYLGADEIPQELACGHPPCDTQSLDQLGSQNENNAQVLTDATGSESSSSQNAANLNSPLAVDPSVIDIHSLDEEAQLLAQISPVKPVEKPFVPLAKNYHQLENEARVISRHPHYKLLTHLAWRQPMLGRREAHSIRIAGGQDLSDKFDFDGNKRASINPFADPEILVLPPLDQLNSSPPDPFERPQAFDEVVSRQIDSQINQPAQNLLPTLPAITPMLWVPELDGDIKIHLNRYLHISTNLFLRRPEKQQIEVVDLTLLSPQTLEQFSVEKPDFKNLIGSSVDAGNILSANNSPLADSQSDSKSEMLPLSPLANPLSQQENQSSADYLTSPALSTDLSRTQSNLKNDKQRHQFSWEIDDDFLQSESEKIYIEKLVNYSVEQTRRVRSGELHYFDHPLLGVLILITPFDHLAIDKTKS